MADPTINHRATGRRTASVLASLGVILVAVGFYTYASVLGIRAHGDMYRLRATFLSSSGLREGADVVLAGVTVGEVTSITLDEHTLMSLIQFKLSQDLRLPIDTRLSIGSATLTSSNALMLSPGKSATMLVADALISNTCELTSLEQQVSRYIFGSGAASPDCGA